MAKSKKRDSKIEIAKATKFLKGLEKQLEDYKKKAPGRLARRFKGDSLDRRPPTGTFEGRSFLYIKYSSRDDGSRPIPGGVYWGSKWIRIRDLHPSHSDSPPPEYEYFVGAKEYEVSCYVSNAGDVDVPAAKVEFFLEKHPLQMDTKEAELIGATSVWLPPFSMVKASIIYKTPPKLEGVEASIHVRVHSIAPLDIPIDNRSLDPRFDRHVATRKATSSYSTSSDRQAPISRPVRHMPNAEEKIVVKPVSSMDFYKAQHNIPGDLKYVAKKSLSSYLKAPKATLQGGKAQLSRKKNTFSIKSINSSGFSIKEQKDQYMKMEFALKNKNLKRKDLKASFDAYHGMKNQMLTSNFQLEIPNLHLKKGELTALDIFHYDATTNRLKDQTRVFFTKSGSFII